VRKLAKCVLSHAISSSCDLFLNNQEINVCFPPMTLLIFHDAFPRFTPLVVPIFLFLSFMEQKDRGGRTGKKKNRKKKKERKKQTPIA
jgi:hypothetical protein